MNRMSMLDYKVLHQQSDQLGEVKVLDNGTYRILAFGDNDEQSKQLKALPHVPQHTYVQAMLMALMFIEVKSAIVLGLGGGALIHSLKKYNASIKMTAVELRPCVIDIAKKYFQLPLSKKLTLIEQDATDFIMHAEHKKVDIIFADLYLEEGVDKKQLSAQFIENSRNMLKEKGMLVLNCWKEQSQNMGLQALLTQYFTTVYACLTGSGNWVIFAAKDNTSLYDQGLKNKMQDLSSLLDFQVGRAINRFGPWQ